MLLSVFCPTIWWWIACTTAWHTSLGHSHIPVYSRERATVLAAEWFWEQSGNNSMYLSADTAAIVQSQLAPMIGEYDRFLQIFLEDRFPNRCDPTDCGCGDAEAHYAIGEKPHGRLADIIQRASIRQRYWPRRITLDLYEYTAVLNECGLFTTLAHIEGCKK